MMTLIRELFPLGRAPVGADMGRCAEILAGELPFKVHEYPSGAEHNGWVIPHAWRVERAEIRRGARVIYDGTQHPLAVIAYSGSFSGRVSLDELRRHLTWSDECPDALVFHGLLYYRHGARDWGFSVPQVLLESLTPGEYEVDLRTSLAPDRLRVLVADLPGDTDEVVILNAHDCHPVQANDDLSGCVAGIEVMHRLQQRRQRRHTYRLMIAPELFGPIFYLAELDAAAVSRLRAAILLKAVGSAGPLALQKTFTGTSLLDRAAAHWFRHRHPGAPIGEFRRVYGNDETVFEAPGFEIPTISLTRYPFPEYHTSLDVPDRIRAESLEEVVETVLGIVDVLEDDATMRRHFDGLLSLSNRKYDLYIKTWDPAQHDGPRRDETRDWHYLMTCLPRYFDGRTTVLEIAERHGLPFRDVYRYVERFRDKGLVSLVPAPADVRPAGERSRPQP
jgi:aminopeptidase-like protein